MSDSPTPAPDYLIDSHVHLDFAQFDADRAAVLQRARAQGVRAFVVPAVIAPHWLRLRSVAAASADVFACYGLHPCFCEHHELEHLVELQAWVEREKPVAIGECGLDFFPPFESTRSKQFAILEPQLALARSHGLPVILHARRAVDAVLKCVRQAGVEKGVIHSFSGSAQQARAALDQGMLIGVGGALTYERANKLRSVVSSLPLDSLVIETDAPDQPGAGHRGERNEPCFLPEVIDVLTQLRTESRETIESTTTENAIRLFSLTV